MKVEDIKTKFMKVAIFKTPLPTSLVHLTGSSLADELSLAYDQILHGRISLTWKRENSYACIERKTKLVVFDSM